MIQFLVWLALFTIAAVGNAARTVAASVRELQPTLLPGHLTKLRRYKWLGALVAFAGLAGAAAWTAYMAASSGLESTMVALIVGGSVVLVLAGLEFGRVLAHKNMDRLARPFLGDAAAFLPLIEAPPESTEPEEVREEAVEQMVEASEKAGLIESDEHEMISGVIGLDTTAVREIMVPRIDIVGVQVNTPLRSALDVIIAGGHSRLPVYEDSLDHVVGLLYAKDLLGLLRDGTMDGELKSIARPVRFVPESMPVDELLQELQQSKVHMAVVVDEYGGTAGIVTIEDVLEEIVGEIQDEYDVGEEPLIESVAENEGIFNALVNIDDVNKALTVNLPEESDTLGGLVYTRLQKIPKVGDVVHVGGITLSVIAVAGRRIKKVRVSKAPANETTMEAVFNEDAEQ